MIINERKSVQEQQVQPPIMAPNIAITDVSGLFNTVSAVPTHVPRKFSEQFVIYTSGATYRLYWYDSINGAWRYATGT